MLRSNTFSSDATSRFFLDHPTLKALLIGGSLGGLSAVLALSLVYAGVLVTFVLVLGLLAGLYVLSSLDAALVVLMATAALLPFGTLPFKIGFTPSLTDCAIGGVLLVYAFQWMTGHRRNLNLTPVSGLIMAFMLLLIFAFVLGLRGSRPTPNQVKTFLELLLSIGMALLLADIASDHRILRRLSLVMLLVGALAGLIGVALWLLPDLTAETMLNRLGRIGYPVGGVIRYREDGVEVGVERAIGTWVDPNAYAGFLLMMGGLAGTQLFSAKPLTHWRGLALLCFGAIGAALFLSDSRGSALGLMVGLATIALLRDRRLIWVGIAGGLLALVMPFTQGFLGRLYDGVTASDLETQMRLGEYQDALELIGRHPVFGVGFTGVPYNDLYIGFSSTYLTLAAYAGLVGLALYLLTLMGIIGWGVRWWKDIQHDPQLSDVWLGLLAGIIGAMVGGVFDHFYFNPQYQSTSLVFWSFIGLFLATTRLASQRTASQPLGDHPIGG